MVSRRCTLLQLDGNTHFGNAGCKALCEVLRLGDDGMASLKDLRLSSCGIGDAGGMYGPLPHDS